MMFIRYTEVRHEDLGPFDVLKGQGGYYHTYRGNLFLKDMTKGLAYKYAMATGPHKTRMAEGIVAYIHRRGGRFLKKNDKCGSWVEVDDKTAREKVSQHLRDAARPFRGEETEPLPLDWELWIPQGVVDPFPDEESLASYLELIQVRRHTMWT